MIGMHEGGIFHLTLQLSLEFSSGSLQKLVVYASEFTDDDLFDNSNNIQTHKHTRNWKMILKMLYFEN